MQRVKEELGSKLIINWRYFSLEQVNSRKGSDWKIWEQSDDYPCRGLRAFRAAEVARYQGEEMFSVFHFALFRARHEQHKNIADMNVINQVASTANLDIIRFRKDYNDRKILTRLAEDHTFAVEEIGIFGTPTLVFPGNRAIFLQMLIPALEESLSVFNDVRIIAEQRQNILEIKRPQSSVH